MQTNFTRHPYKTPKKMHRKTCKQISQDTHTRHPKKCIARHANKFHKTPIQDTQKNVSQDMQTNFTRHPYKTPKKIHHNRHPQDRQTYLKKTWFWVSCERFWVSWQCRFRFSVSCRQVSCHAGVLCACLANISCVTRDVFVRKRHPQDRGVSCMRLLSSIPVYWCNDPGLIHSKMNIFLFW